MSMRTGDPPLFEQVLAAYFIITVCSRFLYTEKSKRKD
jgi:hypothetical protein